MDDQQRPIEPPRESWLDHAQKLGMGALDVYTAGTGGIIVSMVLGMGRRREAFDREVAERIEELERQGRLDRDKLAQNEQFLSTYIEATLAAIRTHEREKRAALRNAVLNSALDDTPDQSLQQMFISLVAEFTHWHLRLLRFFHNPKGAFGAVGRQHRPIAIMGNLPDVLTTLYPELKPREEFVESILAELNSRQLTNVPRYRLTGGDETVYAKRSTKLGDEFLRFIAEPQ